jgi:hypothetical protein
MTHASDRCRQLFELLSELVAGKLSGATPLLEQATLGFRRPGGPRYE